MTNFIPGKIVKTFTTKKGNQAIIRYPKWEDLENVCEYINEISQENTFVMFSGEVIDIKSEATYFGELFKKIEFGNYCLLYCEINGKIIGLCDVNRDPLGKKKGYHRGILGLMIKKAYCGEGIGYELANTVINEVKTKIPGLKMITLDVFSVKKIAQNLYKKLGFIEYGRLPKGIFHKNEYVDRIEMYKEI